MGEVIVLNVKYPKQVFEISRQIPTNELTSAMTWVFDECIIKGRSENDIYLNLKTDYPIFARYERKYVIKWIEYSIEKHIRTFGNYDMATLYDGVLFQHNHIYERLYQFAIKHDVSELKLAVLRAREELLKLISSDPVLYIRKEVQSALEEQHDVNRLDEGELIEFHQLLAKATNQEVKLLTPIESPNPLDL